jgi:intracellular septation protein
MKLLFDILPILLFFITYKLYDIYVATAAAIAAAILGVALTLLRGKKPDTTQLITLLMISILGGATLLFKNEMFIKWKPTVVYWVLAAIFAFTQFRPKTLVQKMLEKSLTLSNRAWQILNMAWFVFFLSMGLINLVVLYSFDTDTWVHFKLFGTLGLTLAFVLVQGIMIHKLSKNHEPQS